jgi:hypothetical protein
VVQTGDGGSKRVVGLSKRCAGKFITKSLKKIVCEEKKENPKKNLDSAGGGGQNG